MTCETALPYSLHTTTGLRPDHAGGAHCSESVLRLTFTEGYLAPRRETISSVRSVRNLASCVPMSTASEIRTLSSS